VRKHNTGQHRRENRAAKSFPGFAGTDSWNHFVLTNERADRVCATVADFRDEDKVQQVVLSLDSFRKEIDFLNEVQQPWDVHQSKEGCRNRENPSGIVFGKELAKAEAKYKQDQKACLKVVHARWRAGGSNLAGQIQKCADHQQHSSENSPAFETNQFAFRRESIKLRQSLENTSPNPSLRPPA